MLLKPQHIVILLKLVTLGNRQWEYSALALDLAMSPSEVHSGIKRATHARLFDPELNVPIIKALEEFIVHDVKYAYPPDRGPVTRGIPTSYAAPPLRDIIVQPSDLPPEWPDSEGNVRGYEFSPLNR